MDRGLGIVMVDGFVDEQTTNHRAGAADERQPEPPRWQVRLSDSAEGGSMGADELDDQGVATLALSGSDETVVYEGGVRANVDLMGKVAVRRGEALDD